MPRVRGLSAGGRPPDRASELTTKDQREGHSRRRLAQVCLCCMLLLTLPLPQYAPQGLEGWNLVAAAGVRGWRFAPVHSLLRRSSGLVKRLACRQSLDVRQVHLRFAAMALQPGLRDRRSVEAVAGLAIARRVGLVTKEGRHVRGAVLWLALGRRKYGIEHPIVLGLGLAVRKLLEGQRPRSGRTKLFVRLQAVIGRSPVQ
eukprot:scaffold266_cov391-Prasinococcus_capsulatus_cf.AAC.32